MTTPPTPDPPSWQPYPCELEHRYYDVKLKSGEVLKYVHPTNYGRLWHIGGGFVSLWRIEAVRLSAEPYPKRL